MANISFHSEVEFFYQNYLSCAAEEVENNSEGKLLEQPDYELIKKMEVVFDGQDFEISLRMQRVLEGKEPVKRLYVITSPESHEIFQEIEEIFKGKNAFHAVIHNGKIAPQKSLSLSKICESHRQFRQQWQLEQCMERFVTTPSPKGEGF